MAAKRDKQTPFNWKPIQRKPFDNSRVIRFKCSLQNTILDVLRSKGWTESREEGEWDFYWCDVGWMRENFDHTYMEEHVKICHFRNHYELTRKNLMAKNLKRLKKQLEREFGKLEAAKNIDAENNDKTLNIDKHDIKKTEPIKLLGVYIDENLNFAGHISEFCTRASQKD